MESRGDQMDDLVATKIAQAFLAELDDRLDVITKRLEQQLVEKTARRLAERLSSGLENSSKPLADLVIERAAKLALAQQREEAQQAERHRLVRAIRNPKNPSLLNELRALAASEASGKSRGGTVPILNMAFKEFGTYDGLLREVENAIVPQP